MSKSERLVETIVGGIKEKKGNNIISLDFSKIENSVSDFFVICDAQSNIQIDAIRKSVEEFALNIENDKPIHIEGATNSAWVVIDFANVIVHIFQTELRDFYKLEELWADAEIKRY